jgi:hypothetical protein
MKMKALTISFTIWLAFTNLSLAQQPQYNWGWGIGGTLGDAGTCIISDFQGNVIVGGSFSETVDFDPSTTGTTILTNPLSSNSNGGFVQKLDINGQLIWVRQISAPNNGSGINGSGAIVKDIEVDSQNNIYVTGSFTGIVDFDPSPISINPITGPGSFVVKLSPNGNLIWVSVFAGQNNFQLGSVDIELDSNGNLFILGGFSGQVDFDPDPVITNYVGYAPSTTTKTFVCKLNNSGQFLDLYTYSPFIDNTPHNLFINSNNEIVISGHCSGGIGGPDYFLVKLDSQLNQLAQINISDGFQQNFFGGLAKCAELSNGNIVFFGQFSGTIDLDPGPGTTNLSTQNFGSFLLKLDNNFNFQSAKMIEGSVNIQRAVCKQGKIFITGDFAGFVDFDPGQSINGITSYNAVQDGFVLVLDENFGYVNVTRYGSYNGDFPANIYVDNTQKVLSTGSYQYSTSLDPAHSEFWPGFGIQDIFVSSINFCPRDSVYEPIQACDVYTSPSGWVFTSNGSYTDTLINQQGCDSIVYHAITIHNSFADTVFVNSCDSAVFNSMVIFYDTLFSTSFQTIHGCDSIISYSFDIHQSQNSTLNLFGCDSVVLDGNVYQQDTTWVQLLTTSFGCDSLVSIVVQIETISPIINFNGLDSLWTIETGTNYWWFRNDTLLTAFNSQNCIANNPGTYYLVLESAAGCIDTSNLIVVSIVLGALRKNYSEIMLIPNPVSEMLKIFPIYEREINIEILGIDGQILFSNFINLQGNNEFILDVNRLPRAFYFIRITQSNSQILLRMCKI